MIIWQKWVTREDLRANRDTYYLFGDNLARKGYGGQAKAMRGEPNAIGIATKKMPINEPSAFFSDVEFKENVATIATDFHPAFVARDEGKIIVCPLDGLGTGLSRLPELAPRTNQVLEHILDLLARGGQPTLKQLIRE